MTDKLFFSYSRFDSAFVLKLANDLRNAGGNIWLDQLDIPPGVHWDSEIEKALNSADSLLVIISPKSLASDNAMDEVSYALEKKKRVIPIMLTDSDTPFRLRRLQRIDFTGDYAEGFRLLKQVLKLEQHATAFFPIQETQKPTGNDHQQMNVEQELWKKCCIANTVSSYQAYLRTTSSKDHLEEAWKRLDLLQEKPLSRAIKFPRSDKTNASAHGKKLILLGGLLVLLAGAWAAYKMVSNNAGVAIAEPKIESNEKKSSDTAKVKPAENIVQVDDRKVDSIIKKADNDHAHDEQKIKDPEITHGKRDNPPITRLNTETGAKNKDSSETALQNDPAKHHSENDNRSPKEEKPKPEAPAPFEPPPVKKPPLRTETNELRTDYILEVKLALVGMPNIHEKKKTDQPVKFSTKEDIIYKGQIIVEKGSLVNGTLTIGNIQTDIEMKNVRETNGKMIRIKSKNPHGRREKVETGTEEYIGVIVKGTDL